MRIAIIGAGLAGLTTAYALRKRRLDVTVLEAADTAGTQASWANGAQLSYSYTDPFASPALLRSLPSILLGQSPGISIRHKAQLRYLRWCAEFVWNCLPAQHRKNAQALESLAARSAELMEHFHQHPELSYYHSRAGKLVLCDTAPGKVQQQALKRKRDRGVYTELLTRDQAIQRAPELTHWNSPFSHAIYAPKDGVADPREFTQSLARLLATMGVNMRFNTAVTRIESTNAGVRLETSDDPQVFDATVVCTGNQSHHLLRETAAPPRLYPISGYSVSVPRGQHCPNVSITSLRDRLVVAPLGERVRIAGFADINPSASKTKQRLAELITTAQRLAPEVADYAATEHQGWVGHRPSTAGGPPCVGATSVKGVFKNLGHGSLGWTLSAATAELTAESVQRWHNRG